MYDNVVKALSNLASEFVYSCFTPLINTCSLVTFYVMDFGLLHIIMIIGVICLFHLG